MTYLDSIYQLSANVLLQCVEGRLLLGQGKKATNDHCELLHPTLADSCQMIYSRGSWHTHTHTLSLQTLLQDTSLEQMQVGLLTLFITMAHQTLKKSFKLPFDF